MKITLLNRPDQRLCAEAAAICTGSDKPTRALLGAMASGHESVLEHCVFTFRADGVSRVLLAQLTRHRIASFSVESQRYCGVDFGASIVPQSVLEAMRRDEKVREAVGCLLCAEHSTYQMLTTYGVPDEDARYLTMQGHKCSLIMTMNARELLHFFRLRCCNRAQWEIRELADEMLALCRKATPVLFAKAGAPCQMGEACPEGKRSCGKPRREDHETDRR